MRQFVCRVAIAAALSAWSVGCGGGSTDPGCSVSGDCEEGMVCVDGACLTPEETCMDEDGDEHGDGPMCLGQDCDDSDPTVHAGATELCGDAVDNDCDGGTDEGFEQLAMSCTSGLGICEAAGTFGCSADRTTLVCNAMAGEPEAERCNALDDDCDGHVDESDGEFDCSCLEGETQPCWTGSAETRNVGVCRDGTQTCLPTGTWGACEGAVEPSTEECNGRDLDCNGLVDDVDLDGDTYFRCPGVSERDCDDDPMAGRNIFPGNLEECNGIDDNCNGLVDEEVLTVYYLDLDGDGYGGSGANVRACTKPDGYADVGGDCNDSNPAIYPGASEVCNDADDDCNGLEDDGLPLISIYPDNDGDSFAPPGETARTKCDVPLGFAAEQDVDGDGTADWDCDDSRAIVNPGAAARCDDLDNDCDGMVDRWCGEQCPGSWPFNFPSVGSPNVAVADMDEDGAAEIAAGTAVVGFLLTHQADVLWRMDGDVNVLRRPGIFADVDASERAGRRTLEWIGGPNGNLTVLQMGASGIVEIPVAFPNDTYDAGTYAARDLTGDDRAEIITMDWNGTIRVASYLEGAPGELGQIVELASMPTPDGTSIYINGFGLGDVDGDGQPEILFGTGYAYPSAPSGWSGNVWAFRFDPTTMSLTDACPGCYDTAISGLYPSAVWELLLHDTDGDGTDELWAEVHYFETNTPGVRNTPAGTRLWSFDPATGAALSMPATGALELFYDADGDGTAEAHPRDQWTHDVDGDGDLDLVGFSDGRPYLRRRDGTSFEDMPTGVSAPGAVRYMGDLDGDGRLDVLIGEDSTGRLHCVRFGPGTHNPWSSWGPPMRGPYDTRTGQLDQGEPNDDVSNAVYQGNDRMYRGFITSPTDIDWIRVESYCMHAVVQAPSSHDLRVRTYLDLSGTRTLLRDEVVPAGTRQTRTCGDDPAIGSPVNKTLWIEIRGEGGSSPTDPYFIRFRDSF